MSVVGPPIAQNRPTRVLLVDDDVELAEMVGEYLSREGFALDPETDGLRALDRALSGEYQLTVLDVMLPGVSGFDVLRAIRARSPVPVLMLTARGDDVDRIVGLELGADDYLSKPFNPRELCARIDAILRRSRPEPLSIEPRDADRVVVDDVTIDKGARVVRHRGIPISLTTVEFDLLDAFLRSAGRVVPREELVRTVLGREFSPFDRGIDNHVSNLRKKLGPTSNGLERIKSVRGIGYQYALTPGSYRDAS
jgi:DNA-binding response OmpR family regulator